MSDFENKRLLDNHPEPYYGPGRNIAIAVDDSDYSLEALNWALDTIVKEDDALTLVHVFEFNPLPPIDMYGGGPSSVTEINNALEKQAEEKAVTLLRRYGKLAKDRGFKPHMTAVRGIVKESIVDFTQRHLLDLLIMGSRGRGAVKRFFLGSVADYCVHHCECPVIVKKKGKKAQVKPGEYDQL